MEAVFKLFAALLEVFSHSSSEDRESNKADDKRGKPSSAWEWTGIGLGVLALLLYVFYESVFR